MQFWFKKFYKNPCQGLFLLIRLEPHCFIILQKEEVMRRMTVLLLAMAFAFGSVTAAKADGIDIKAKGQWDFAFGWATNGGFADSSYLGRSAHNNDQFIARHRVRAQINFITSEYLQGVVMFEIGNLDWGRNAGGKNGQGSGGGLDADGVNVETKRAYLDWMIPETEISVRMGIQGLKLPSTPMGSPVMDADVAGIVVSSPIDDMFAISAFWIRPFNMHLNDNERAGRVSDNLQDEMDLFGLLLPIKGDGWAVTPWGMYSRIGAASGYWDYMYSNSKSVSSSSIDNNDHSWAWWAGFHFKLTMFDPLSFNFEAIYGDAHKTNVSGLTLNSRWGALGVVAPNYPEYGTRGWFLAATLDYKLDWAVPGIFGWWSSGDSKNALETGQLGRLPVLSTDGGFQPTTFGALGSPAIATEGVIMGSGTGTWGIGIQLAKISFIEDLKHTIRIAYYRGTNDSGLVEDYTIFAATRGAGDMYLTDKDSVIEVNFDHEYKIYENLTALLELGYIHLSLDDDVWNKSGANRAANSFLGGDRNDSQNAWKAQLQFQYKF